MPARSWSKGTDHAAQYPRRRKIPKTVKPKPDCPTCGKGFMRERVEVNPEAETRIKFMACDVCGAGFDELGNQWGSLTQRALDGAWACANCGKPNIAEVKACWFCETPRK